MLRACRRFPAFTAGRGWRSTLPCVVGGQPMILSAIAEKLQRRSKDDFKGRHFEASLILQAVCWYLRCPLSCRDIEELFRERGLTVDHSPCTAGSSASPRSSRSECATTCVFAAGRGMLTRLTFG